jgi:acetylglutamate kinase
MWGLRNAVFFTKNRRGIGWVEDIFKVLDANSAEQYVETFKNKVFVVKCGGTLLEDTASGAAFLDDVALLWKKGIRPALVHGGGVQADAEMEAAGIKPERYKGLRITGARTIEILDRCFGALNAEIVAELQKRGADAAGFSGARGGLILGGRLQPDGVDIGLVGEVTGINAAAWESAAGKIPVVSSLGVDSEGNTLNINADYVATQLALLVKAEKLILMTDVDGVLLDPEKPETLIPTLTVSRARELIGEGAISRGMIPKIESAVLAIELGLPKIHLINGRTPHSLLLEIFTDKGVGTQIIPG